jgi:hypothetical protein
LLSDIQEAFHSEDIDRLSSEDLVRWLVSREDRPWSEWKGGKPISKSQVSRLLKQFGISSKSVRTQAGTPKGYCRCDFADAFSRYLPSENATPQQASNINKLDEKKTATEKSSVADHCSEKASNINGVALLRFKTGYLEEMADLQSQDPTRSQEAVGVDADAWDPPDVGSMTI